ncbi:MAG: hypothetical protein WDN50_07850 [Bradyrhizobium sp.]
MQKLIYLDSNDFSDLSAPAAALGADDAAILAALRKAQADNSARILMSPPLLSEAVHATMANKQDSMRRASLMRELCGTNILRLPTDICSMEIDRALSNDRTDLTLKDILSSEDEWFGCKFDANSLSESRRNAQQTIDQGLDRLPRAQRRKFKSQLDLSKASSKPIFRQLIKDGRSTPTIESDPLLSLINQDLFVDWFLREKSDEDIRQHLRRLMSDPYVLFGHFVDRTGHREQLYALTRTAGEKLSTDLESVGQNLMNLFEISTEAHSTIDTRKLAKQFVSKEFVRRLLTGFSSRSLDSLSESEIDSLFCLCPAIATMTHVILEYVHTLVQSNLSRFQTGNRQPTTPKKSDFGDLMHLLYAPYMDIFRCDARFGAHLKSHKPIRTKIAARRTEILAML